MAEGEGISLRVFAAEEDSSRNMAEVRPVRQPWSRWVAHQSSWEEEVDDVSLVEDVGEELGGVGK